MTDGGVQDLELVQNDALEIIQGDALRFCLERLPSFEGRIVLDIGAGSGAVSVLLAQGGAHVVPVDLRHSWLTEYYSLTASRRRAARAGVADRIHYVHGDGQCLPVANQSVDYVCIVSALQFMDFERLTNEMLRVLRPGGTFFLVHNLPANPMVTLYRFLRRLRSAYNRLTPDDGTRYAESIRSYTSHRDLCQLSRHFRTTHARAFHLLMPAVYGLIIHRQPNELAARLLSLVMAADRRLVLRIPALGHLAWIGAYVFEHRLDSQVVGVPGAAD